MNSDSDPCRWTCLKVSDGTTSIPTQRAREREREGEGEGEWGRDADKLAVNLLVLWLTVLIHCPHPWLIPDLLCCQLTFAMWQLNQQLPCNVAQHWHNRKQVIRSHFLDLPKRGEQRTEREGERGERKMLIKQKSQDGTGHILLCKQDSPSIAFVCLPYCLQEGKGAAKGLRSALKFRNMFHIIDDEPAPIVPHADHCPLRRRRCRHSR